MSAPTPVATFRAVPGGYAAMDIDDSRVMSLLTRAELLGLAAAATAMAATLSAPTPAHAVGRLKTRTP